MRKRSKKPKISLKSIFSKYAEKNIFSLILSGFMFNNIVFDLRKKFRVDPA